MYFPQCTLEEKTLSGATDFTLKTLDGKEITLSEFRGKVVLLDFWATWCGPCRDSISHLIRLYNTQREQGLEIIGLSLDRGDPSQVSRFVKSEGIPYPVALSSESVARHYEVTSIPTAFLIDKKGQIRDKIVGFSSTVGKKIETSVQALISENP